ncbi:MAG: sigma-70 family RNA polymerase sigma factor [Gemmatimonadota bacterium]
MRDFNSPLFRHRTGASRLIEHSASLRSYLVDTAYRIVRDWDQSEDVVQDVLVRAWRLDPSDRSKKYLCKAVRNHAITMLRRERRHTVWLAQQDHAAVSTPTNLDSLLTAELAAQIGNVVNRLPARLKTIAQMHWQEGRTCREIAEALGLSLKTVENHVTRALKVIRNAYPDSG